jgi:type VII secretion integral membrane protein EccD
MGTLVGLLFLLTASPTAALWVARVRPPHFGSVTGRDVFHRTDGLPIDAVVPVPSDAGEHAEDEGIADPTPSGRGIAAAAVRANGVLTGICLASALALPVAVWFTVMPGQPRSTAAAALGALFIVIFISRARSFADRRQAVALVGGAAAAFCGATVRFVLAEPSPAALLCGAAAVVGFGTAGLGAALLVPATPFTPLVRMAIEWLELLAITAALPLAAWVGGLFAWVRLR